MSLPHDESPRRVLRGWKEIAGHVGISPRSAQLYATEAGLPVYRPGGRASVSAFADELTEWMRGRAVPARSGGLEPHASTDKAATGASRVTLPPGAATAEPQGLDGTSGTGVRVVAALVATICLACLGAWWVLRSPDGVGAPRVASFRLQVGVSGAGPFVMEVAEGHPATIEFDRSAISIVASRTTDGLRVVLYDGEVEEAGAEQPPLGEATLAIAELGAPPARLKFPRGVLELVWIGQ